MIIKVHVYKYVNNQWIFWQELVKDVTLTVFDANDCVVDINDNIIVIGWSFVGNYDNINSGRIFIYELDIITGYFKQVIIHYGKYINPKGNFFGDYVAIRNNIIIVGCKIGDRDLNTNHNLIYIFEKNNYGYWNFIHTINISYGFSISYNYYRSHHLTIGNDGVIIGYTQPDINNIIYIFICEYYNGSWITRTYAPDLFKYRPINFNNSIISYHGGRLLISDYTRSKVYLYEYYTQRGFDYVYTFYGTSNDNFGRMIYIRDNVILISCYCINNQPSIYVYVQNNISYGWYKHEVVQINGIHYHQNINIYNGLISYYGTKGHVLISTPCTNNCNKAGINSYIIYKSCGCVHRCGCGPYAPIIGDKCYYDTHCNGGSCNIDTGICNNCLDNYYGNLCQIPPLGPGNTCLIDTHCNDHGTCNSGICICKDNYTGTFCNIPPIINNKCTVNEHCNYGTCNGIGNCECINDYTGLFCEIPPITNDQCSHDSHCNNNGICENNICFCINNFTSKFCNIPPIGPDHKCSHNSHCYNNGTCNLDLGTCTCVDNYTGTFCNDLDDGCINDSQCNHGTCNNNGLCICNDDYSGTFCDIPPIGPDNKCSHNQHCNGGFCNLDSGICVCLNSYSGNLCDIPPLGPDNKCTVNAHCNGGVCNLDLGTCTNCIDDYTGDLCQVPPIGPDNKCTIDNHCNGGLCNLDSGICLCANNYSGDLCDVPPIGPNNECSHNAHCNGGICNLDLGICTNCVADYTGNLCQIPPIGPDNKCTTDDHCNDGLCNVDLGICVCIDNYSGDLCDVPPLGPDNKCTVNAHCNGGICDIDLGTCTNCIDNYTGDLCQVPPIGPDNKCTIDDHCNGGLCNLDSGICLCTNNYSGDLCQVPPIGPDNKCTVNAHCNGGICNLDLGTCTNCIDDYTGDLCQIPPIGPDNKCTIDDHCNGGLCNLDSGICLCANNYSGDLCDVPPIGPNNECSHNAHCNGGICNLDLGICTNCVADYTGDLCQIPPIGPNNSTCTVDDHCNGGICNLDSGICDCIHDYSGNLCTNAPECPTSEIPTGMITETPSVTIPAGTDIPIDSGKSVEAVDCVKDFLNLTSLEREHICDEFCYLLLKEKLVNSTISNKLSIPSVYNKDWSIEEEKQYTDALFSAYMKDNKFDINSGQLKINKRQRRPNRRLRNLLNDDDDYIDDIYYTLTYQTYNQDKANDFINYISDNQIVIQENIINEINQHIIVDNNYLDQDDIINLDTNTTQTIEMNDNTIDMTVNFITLDTQYEAQDILDINDIEHLRKSVYGLNEITNGIIYIQSNMITIKNIQIENILKSNYYDFHHNDLIDSYDVLFKQQEFIIDNNSSSSFSIFFNLLDENQEDMICYTNYKANLSIEYVYNQYPDDILLFNNIQVTADIISIDQAISYDDMDMEEANIQANDNENTNDTFIQKLIDMPMIYIISALTFILLCLICICALYCKRKRKIKLESTMGNIQENQIYMEEL